MSRCDIDVWEVMGNRALATARLAGALSRVRDMEAAMTGSLSALRRLRQDLEEAEAAIETWDNPKTWDNPTE